VGLSELFCESDLISINVVLTDQTRGMIHSDVLKLMKPTAYIINMASGPVWNSSPVSWILGLTCRAANPLPVFYDFRAGLNGQARLFPKTAKLAGILRAFHGYLGSAATIGDIPSLGRFQVHPNGKSR